MPLATNGMKADGKKDSSAAGRVDSTVENMIGVKSSLLHSSTKSDMILALN